MKFPKFLKTTPSREAWILAAAFSVVIAGIVSAILELPVPK